MHLLFGLVVVLVIAYFVSRAIARHPAASSAEAAGARSDRPFAFLSSAALFYREGGGEIKQLHSPYAQAATDRRERSRERNAWKEGTAFNIAAGGRRRGFEPSDKPFAVTGAAYVGNGDLVYFLKDENMGGLFRREAATGNELRIMIKQGLSLSGLRPSEDGARIAASSLQADGTANICMMQADGSGYRELTSGDTIDSAPAWIPAAPQRMLFQSVGLARDPNGYIVASGAASIQKLDLETGSVAPILEDPQFDYLHPRVDSRGGLLFIRRPHESGQYGMQSAAADALFFPFRLLRAVFHYLNFFSLMYSRKPLTSADLPGMQADMKSILLQGRRVDAEKALRTARSVQGVPSLVPDSWELVRRDERGEERCLATNVASFDVAPDDSITYSNGRGVFVLEADGAARTAATDQLVLEVIAAR